VQVRLYIRVRLAIGKRVYANPAYAPNGRIKPFYAVIEDKLEHHPEGVYHLRYVKNGKRVWRAVGTDAYPQRPTRPAFGAGEKLSRSRFWGCEEYSPSICLYWSCVESSAIPALRLCHPVQGPCRDGLGPGRNCAGKLDCRSVPAVR
jgi:hypothetical protein